MNIQQNISSDGLTKTFIKYVSTSTAGMLMISMYILFDTIFVGQSLGEVGLAALNISIPIYNFLFGTGILIGTGGAIIISIKNGSNDNKSALRVFEHSIMLGALVGIIFSILGYMFLETLVLTLGAGPDNKAMVRDYLGVIMPFSWSFIMVYNLAAIVRNDNGPKRAMIAMGLGGLTNIVFDYIFIFPLNMGIKGAAIATVMSSLVSLLILLWHFIGKHSSFKVNSFRLDKKLSLRIAQTGFPSFIIELSSGLIIYIFNKELIKTLGYIGVSAYSIIANLALMIIAIFNGVSQGIQPIVSYNYGANNLDNVNKVKRYGVTLSLILGLCFLTLGLLIPEFLISLFTSETGEIVEITKLGIRIYFLSFPIAGINVVLNGFLQSIELSKLATFISVLRGIVFNWIGLKVLTTLFDATGIWLTTPTTEILTMFVISIFLLQLNKELSNKVMALNKATS